MYASLVVTDCISSLLQHDDLTVSCFLCTVTSFPHMLLPLQQYHTVAEGPGPLMSACVLSLPTVMTTGHLSLQGFTGALY